MRAWWADASAQEVPADASADWLASVLQAQVPLSAPAVDAAPDTPAPEPLALSEPTVVQEPLADQVPEPVDSAESFEPSGWSQAAPAPDDLREIGPVRISIRLYNVFLDEADTWSRQLLHALDEWVLQNEQPVPVDAVGHAHALAGSAATVGFAELAELAHRTELALDQVAMCQWGARQLPPDTNACLSGVARELRAVLHQFAAGIYKVPQADWLQRIDSLIDDLRAAPPAFSRATDTPVATGAAQRQILPVGDGVQDRDAELHDLPDPDLFPLFEEEAHELMPRLVAVLRQWVAQPDDRGAVQEVLRLLHTFKGSARLAGALRLGERAHELETQVQTVAAATPDDLHWLQSEVDELVLHLQRLSPQSPDWLASPAEWPVAPPPEPQAPQAEVVLPPLDPQAIRLPLHPSAGQTRTNRATIRVASELLDRLVNETGEVMISRARVQGELAAVRGSLADLNANLERLRLQLRDMELQTETQMQSRLALARDTQQAFDPLEFDRFTRVQEITRSMAESVSDVATVQRQLQRAVDGADDQLQAQARQSRNLQRELLSTRLVEFEAMAERLYRVVRQASKESNKSVRLDILGGRIEMDRGTLDRLSPAFEHVLRNAVVHGIESADQRLVAGKPAEGRIAIELTQVGNDVTITVSDDGAGLDTAALAQRALGMGLPVPASADDAAWCELVFVPGLSTASELSALAGRGVGMDVVRHDITALGGRVQLQQQPQQGCQVQMTLPLTTAITQVVVMRAGEHVFGVPAGLVDLVRRFDGPTLRQAHADGGLLVDGERLDLFWAGALLRHSPAPTGWLERGNTCVLLRSAGQRVALHVDEVLGSQEVVVKKLGAQLSGVPGLVGMSILGSGAVALIHNPVVLARLHGDSARAYAASAQTSSAVVEATPVVVSRQPLVLVVDDSITVRRVTQRLLAREGYRVALAADGLQALELLQQESPAAVLCDIEMPRMDGFDLVRNLRGDARWTEVPVIMITSRIADKHRQLALSLGANHYLGKPYPEDELLGLLARYTRRSD
jgi:chemosensory pili system protein ChpA (sensor histidine kinase/response regulator)